MIVANGHNWSPKLPDVRGHGRLPRRDDPRVVVQGRVHAARSQGARGRRRQHRLRHRGRGARRTRPRAGTPVRRGYWYAPKFVFGRPADQVNDSRWPSTCRCGCASGCSRARCGLTVGDLTRYGLPKPDHRVVRDAPDRELAAALLHRPRRRDARRRGAASSIATASVLANGERIEPDLVIFATGYLPRFEFLGAGRARRRRARAGRSCSLHTFARRYPTLGGRRPGAAGLRRLPDRALADRGDRALAATARGRPGAGPPSSGARHRRPPPTAAGRTPRSRTRRGTGSRSATPSTCGRCRRPRAIWRRPDDASHDPHHAAERVGPADPAGTARGRQRPVGLRRAAAADPVRAGLRRTAPGPSRSTGSSTPPQRGFPAYAMSLRGHGASGTAGKPDLRAYVHDVVQVAAGLPRQAVLVGHGAGALVVAHALARYPARAGVLIAPVFGGWRTLGARAAAQPVRHRPGGLRRPDPGAPRPAVRPESALVGVAGLPGPARRGVIAARSGSCSDGRRRKRPVGDPPVLVVGSPDDKIVPHAVAAARGRSLRRGAVALPGHGPRHDARRRLGRADRRDPRLAEQGRALRPELTALASGAAALARPRRRCPGRHRRLRRPTAAARSARSRPRPGSPAQDLGEPGGHRQQLRVDDHREADDDAEHRRSR